MAISRDPDQKPQIDPAQLSEARKTGLKMIQVICDTPEGEPDDPEMPPISFIAYTEFIPRIGEGLLLQDGKQVIVQDVSYNLVNAGERRFLMLVPLIYTTVRRDRPQPA